MNHAQNNQTDEIEKKNSLLRYRCSADPIENDAASHTSLSSFSASPERLSPRTTPGAFHLPLDHIRSSARQAETRSLSTSSGLKNNNSNNNVSSSKLSKKVESFLNVVWRNDDDEDDDDEVDNSAAVAQLSKDFDLMFGDNGDNTQAEEYSPSAKECCRQNGTSARCSGRLEIACLALSIITFIVALLLAIQTITAQQYGSSILCLVESLVFLFLIFLQKKGLKAGTAVGCVIASLSVVALCAVVLAVWIRDLVLLLSTNSLSSSSLSSSNTIENPQSLADVVELKLFPNPQPQLWGCFPTSNPVTQNNNNNNEDNIPIIAIQDLSIGCLVSQTILGVLSSISLLSSIGVAIVSSWTCVLLYGQHRRKSRNTATVCPARLQRTTSTPLSVEFNATCRSTHKLNT